ncbi:MAG: branched-chain amino acid ABC transporter permease [Gammaproteobacteria bacterium]|nr:branched-chain amino acid ABC transporter permease [Gammaproteobacteria bacterium]
MNRLLSEDNRAQLAFGIMAILLLSVGYGQSWSLALTILNLCLISAVMSLGVNIQWGYAGLLNLGVMGFTSLGGLAAVLVSEAPVLEAWAVGGQGMVTSFVLVVITIVLAILVYRSVAPGRPRQIALSVLFIGAYFVINSFYGPAVQAIEGVNPASQGFLGGMGLPIVFSWILGGILAAGVAWIIGKITLGLRSDYLAIATLGISEIIIAVLKNEDWLARGVKNVVGMDPAPVPEPIELQNSPWFIDMISNLFSGRLSVLTDTEYQKALNDLVIQSSSIFVKLCFTGLFLVILVVVLWLSIRALNSPWGRMMRSIRDNEEAANAMGKNVVKQHLQVFILGSAVVGIAGAMLVTLDGQFTPTSYQPLRFTFLVWLMVIVGGSGNNLGAVFGGFFIWFMWIEAEPASIVFMDLVTSGMDESNSLREHLLKSAPHLRLAIMGFVLLFTMRFMPKGIIPEKTRLHSV